MSWWEGQNNGELVPLHQGLNRDPEWKLARAGEGGNAATNQPELVSGLGKHRDGFQALQCLDPSSTGIKHSALQLHLHTAALPLCISVPPPSIRNQVSKAGSAVAPRAALAHGREVSQGAVREERSICSTAQLSMDQFAGV